MTAILTLVFTFSLFSKSEFSLKNNLSDSNRKQIVKVLGLGTNYKNTSVPGGLGTDHGLEIAIANEFINTEQISSLIADDRSQNTLIYPKISIGKGLYDSFDLFVHFIPYTATLGLSEFGGAIRYHMLKLTNSRMVASFVLSANSSNFNNQLTSKGIGVDFSMGMRWEYFSVFSSLGWAQAKGTFVGGSQGVTDTLLNQTEVISTTHFSVGGLAQYDIYFISLALDHYYEPVYTVKVGFYF
jgi:hypothetical protein